MLHKSKDVHKTGLFCHQAPIDRCKIGRSVIEPTGLAGSDAYRRSMGT